MKKKIIIIGTIIIFIFVVIVILLTIYKSNDNSIIKKDTLEILYEKIENKEDIVINITDKVDNCNFCHISKNMIDYYDDTFSLNMITFNKSNYDEKDFNNLISKLGINLDSFIVAPAIIIVKNGIAVTIINEIHDEVDLKNYMIEYGYLDKEYLENDIQVNDGKLEDLYNGENKSLVILIDNNNIKSYNYRRKILELSKEYKFKYNVYIAGTVGSLMGNIKFMDEIDEDIELPYMVIIGDGKIIDYTTNRSNEKIEKFLKDNNII